MAFSAALFDIVSSQMTQGSALPQKMFNYTRGFSLSKSLSDRWAATLTTQIVILPSGEGTVFTFSNTDHAKGISAGFSAVSQKLSAGKTVESANPCTVISEFLPEILWSSWYSIGSIFLCHNQKIMKKKLILRLYTYSGNKSICKQSFKMKLS